MRSRTWLFIFMASLAFCEATFSQEERAVLDLTSGIYRADNLGIEFQLAPYNGHYAARLTRILSSTAPVNRVQTQSGPFRIEVGDWITKLDQQVFDRPGDLLNHVDDTTIEFIDGKTNLLYLGRLVLPSTATATPTPQPTTPTSESQRIHALLVIDTASNLAGLDVDKANMRSLLEAFERERRADVRILEHPREVNRDEILRFFRSLPDVRRDTVLLYYSGHGATDPRRGHYIHPTNGANVLRSELRNEFTRLNPRLSLLITDCCSNAARLPPFPSSVFSKDELIAYDLFLRAQGIVDITAATYDPRTGVGESAWCDDDGGFFTSAFRSTVRYGKRERLDASHDGIVSWQEFFPTLQAATNQNYQRYRERLLSQGGSNTIIQAIRQQPNQRPQMFR